MKLEIQTARDAGFVTIDSNPIGKGGEGSVYRVKNTSISGMGEMVAKIYHNPNEGEREQKVTAMVKNPPEDPAVAFPMGVLRNNGKFVGYVMKKLDSKTYRIWYELAHRGSRLNTTDNFTVRYAINGSYNLANAIRSVHRAGHCLGDINESNIFIGTDTSVFIVDTDSAQISANGKTFKCLVGKPEYTAPEISHGSFKDNKRTEATDVFAYSVVVYQMLVGGAHPTQGIPETGETLDVMKKIRRGIYPNLVKTPGWKPLDRVPTQGIPTKIRKVLLDGLSTNPANRPSMDTIIDVFEDVIDHLVQCKKVSSHWYDSRDKKCLWCKHSTAVDIWAGEELEKFAKSNWDEFTPGRISHKKLNGVTLLEYTDGRVAQRPAIWDVFYQNPRLGVQCLVNELPEYARWSYRKTGVPRWGNLLIGALLGAIVPVFLFFWGTDLLVKYGYANALLVILVELGALTSFFFLVLCVLNLAFNTWKTRGFKERPREPNYDSIWRPAAVSLFYGPVFLVGIAVYLFLLFLNFVSVALNVFND